MGILCAAMLGWSRVSYPLTDLILLDLQSAQLLHKNDVGDALMNRDDIKAGRRDRLKEIKGHKEALILSSFVLLFCR